MFTKTKLLDCSQTSLILKESSGFFFTFLRVEEIYTSFIYEGLSKRRTIRNNKRWRRESEQYCQGNWPKKVQISCRRLRVSETSEKNPTSKSAF